MKNPSLAILLDIFVSLLLLLDVFIGAVFLLGIKSLLLLGGILLMGDGLILLS